MPAATLTRPSMLRNPLTPPVLADKEMYAITLASSNGRIIACGTIEAASEAQAITIHVGDLLREFPSKSGATVNDYARFFEARKVKAAQ